MGDFDPYIYKTTDYGQSWTKISDGIPKNESSFVHVVREDPKRKGMLYAGIDKGIYISYDDGGSWNRLRQNLPPAPVYWLDIQERFDDLVVGTYGRGYYIMDDLSAVRFADRATDKVTLYKPRDAWRFNNRESIKTDGQSYNSGRNPAYGAQINYYLPEKADSAMLHIYTASGELVRSLKAAKTKGINRTYWDRRYEPSYRPKLRVQPPGRPWDQLNGEGWRPLVTWDLDLMAGQFGPRVVPGTYTAKLVVDGEETSQTFEVRKDPNAEGTNADIAAQVDFSLQLRDAMNIAVSSINRIEGIRKELETILTEEKDRRIQKEAVRMKKLAEDIAGKLYDIHLTGAREDAFRSPMRLYGRLSALASDINSSGIDYRPTNQQGEVYEVLNGRLQQVQTQFEEFIQQDVERFNKALQRKNRSLKVEEGLER